MLMFLLAIDKAREICGRIFAGRDTVSVCLALYGDTYRENLSTFRSLRKLGIEVPKDHEVLPSVNKEYGTQRILLFFEIESAKLEKILFGKLGAELGIRPTYSAGLYLYDLELGILVHPYDDRGMDVVGPNRELMQELYDKYTHWLLEYDRERMDKWFGN